MAMTIRPPQTAARRPVDSLAHFIDTFFSNPVGELFETDLVPATNIAEDEHGFTLELEMPGLDEKDIQVEVHDGRVHVNAERRDQREQKGKNWHRLEQRFGRLSRTIALPKGIQADQIQASYKKGMLTLTVPKAPEAKPTRISIKGE